MDTTQLTPDAPTAPREPQPIRWRLALTGAIGVGAALGVGELLAGLVGGVPSPVSSIGSWIVDLTPGGVSEWAIQLFGTADKLILALGTVVVAVAVGAFAGYRSLGSTSDVAPWFAAFGLLGLAAMLSQPLVDVWLTVIAAIVAPLVGVGAFHLMAAAATPPAEEPTDALATDGSRRRFLLLAAGTGVAAAATGAVGRSLLNSPSTPSSVLGGLPQPVSELPPPGPGQAFDVAGLDPIVVPGTDFYRIDTALVIPQVNEQTWQMRIHGMVDNEISLSYDDLLARPLVERYVTLSCVSNEVGGDLVGNALWTGVRLAPLLEEAGIHPDAGQVVGRSVDDWTAGFPTEVVFDGRDPIIAVGMNGEPLPRRHGFPARLIVPGLYGYVSATKWLSGIELTTWDGFDAYWIPRGWAKEGPMKTQSRIDVPRNNEQVTGPEVVVAGIAWAPTRGIDRVEVRADGGPWQEAEITSPLSDSAWVQFRQPIDLESGSHRIEVRATDGTGETQSGDEVPPKPDGAEGWHTIRVQVA